MVCGKTSTCENLTAENDIDLMVAFRSSWSREKVTLKYGIDLGWRGQY
ncbi:MAG: hypothetical protein WC560_10845 [Syntrophales bacterium]